MKGANENKISAKNKWQEDRLSAWQRKIQDEKPLDKSEIVFEEVPILRKPDISSQKHSLSTMDLEISG
jgi:hypothetical protein